MARHSLASTTLLVIAAALAASGASSGSCYGEGPEAVLDCFSAAYSDRDPTMLENVMAPDYTWVRVAPPEVDIYSREESVNSSVRMFLDPEVESVSLEFGEGYRVEACETPDTWRLEDVKAMLTVRMASVAEPRVTPLCVTFYVRKTSDTPLGYQVHREVFFEGNGCAGK